MHEGQVETSTELVRELLERQFPELADAPIRPVAESGTDHDLYRVGDDLVARLPIIDWAVDQAGTDARWLALLAPHLHLRIPKIMGVGEPAAGFPWRWSLVRWVAGETADDDNLDQTQAAVDLARFVTALHGIPADGGPVKSGTSRGAPLANLDAGVRPLIAELASEIDAAAVTRVWDEAVAAPAWDGLPVWLHGDLQPGNLIVRDRHLTAVIDFGGIGLGDPAVDLIPAWNTFDREARKVFREAVGHDDATWARARGWILAPALQGLGYYRESRPEFVESGRRRIAAVLAD